MTSTVFPSNVDFFFVHSDGTKTKVDSIPKVTVSAGEHTTQNTVLLHEPFQLYGRLNISFIGSNNTVEIGSNLQVFGSLVIRCREQGSVSLGNNNSIHDLNIVNDTEPKLSVNIGNDNLFSSSVFIRTSDGHTILHNGEAVNTPQKGVQIGNHVWIGNGVTILKDTSLGDNVVVGTMAVVTKSFESGTLVAGIPAKVVKEDITWDRRNTYVYEAQNKVNQHSSPPADNN